MGNTLEFVFSKLLNSRPTLLSKIFLLNLLLHIITAMAKKQSKEIPCSDLKKSISVLGRTKKMAF